MRRATLPIELLLLAFLGVFLLYPLAYILPGSASDEELEIVLFNTPANQQLLEKLQHVLGLRDAPPELPFVFMRFPSSARRDAEMLVVHLRAKGGVEFRVSMAKLRPSGAQQHLCAGSVWRQA